MVDSYLGQEQVRVTVAPQRAGYVVRPGVRTEIVRAISAASRRWGGITEPLVPIGDDGSVQSLDLQIVQTLAPDVLVAVAPDITDDERHPGLSVHYRLNAFSTGQPTVASFPLPLRPGRLERKAERRGLANVTHLIPGADVYVKGVHIGEIDLFGFIGQDVVAGEVKTSPQDFTAEQIDKDLEKAVAVGADVYVVASSGKLDQAQRMLAQEKADGAGCRLTILDLED